MSNPVDIMGTGHFQAVRDYIAKFNIDAAADDLVDRTRVTGRSAWAVGAAFANVGWEVRS